VVKAINYTSFGMPQGAAGGVVIPYLFTGREYDLETGLYGFSSQGARPTTTRRWAAS
jgi:hypothetical protein